MPPLIEDSFAQRSPEDAESEEQKISNVCNALDSQKWQRHGISGFCPLFMHLWHAINLSRLDREITPCLPANKPGHSCPAPIYYSQVSVMSRSNLLHSQGQG